MHRQRSLIAFVVLLAQAACDASRGTTAPPTTPDTAPASVAATTPLSSAAAAGATLGALSVRVSNRLGQPLSGVSVSFRVASGGGSVTPTSATTDEHGVASAVWTLGPTAGAQSLAASVQNLTPVMFTTTATPAAAATITKVSGDAQSAIVNTAVAIAPSVKLVDAGGNAVPDVDVTFSVRSGDGRVTGAAARSGADGVARAGQWTLGTKAGENILQASAGGNLVATFTAIGRPGEATSLTLTSNASVELHVGDKFVVTAKAFDAFGNENPSSAITYGVSPVGSGTVDAAGAVTALAAGRLTISATTGASTSGAGSNVRATYTAVIIGHPVGATVAARLFVGVDPSSVAVTDDGILAVSATGSNALVTRLSLDGSTQFASLAIQSAALGFLVVAPKRGGGTAVVVSTGALTSSYWFVDIASNTIVDSITTLRYVQGAAMSADGKRAYFLLDAGELAVLDVATHQFLPTIPLGGGIADFRAAPGDTIAYARSSVGTMLEIDLTKSTVRRQFNIPPYTDVVPSRDLSQFYAIDHSQQLLRILRSADLTQQLAYVTDATTVSVAPDSRAVFMTLSDRVEVAIGDAVGGLYPGPRYVTSGPPTRVLFSTDGSIAVVPTTNGWIDIIR